MATITLRQAVVALLAADVTLMATLTGGVYDRRMIGRSKDNPPYDSRGSLEPCAVVTTGTSLQAHPGGEREGRPFEQQFFQVWLYEEEGNAYAAIDIAADRLKALLYGQTVSVSPGGVHHIRFADGVGDSFDEVLGAEMVVLRFYAWRSRG